MLNYRFIKIFAALKTEMRMILDSLLEDGYVIGHKSDKPPYGLTYQYIPKI